MYTHYFGFNEKPFTLTPNPRFIFLSKNHKEAFAHLLYGINNHYGFIELIGEVGTGKTTVLRTLLGQLQEENYRTALVFNPCLTGVELLRTICHEFDLEAKSDYTNELLTELNRFLLSETASGKTVVLVIDEAQNLQPEVLEQIRLISNLETDNDKLIQIILAGQPELETLLERPDLRQLNQRIAVRYRLKSMSMSETRDYIKHRMEIAGDTGGVYFTGSAIKWIHLYTRGVPRMINILCDRSLLIAYSDERRKINAPIVSRGIREILNLPHNKRRRSLVIFFLILVLSVILFYTLTGRISLENIAVTSPKSIKNQDSPAKPNLSISNKSEKEESSTKTFDDFKKEILSYSQQDTHIHAFNALADLWNERTIKLLNGQLTVPDMFRRLAKKRNLNVTEFKGSLDSAIKLNLPMIAMTKVTGNLGNYALAITSVDQNSISIAPSLFAQNVIEKDDFEKVAEGRFYLVWKNIGQIPPLLSPGEKRFEIRNLQKLLQQAGRYHDTIDGVYNQDTISAVLEFQKANNIPTNRAMGELTLAILSRYQTQIPVPTLSR